MTVEKFLTLSKSILCLSIAASFLFVMPYIINSQLTSARKDVTIEFDAYRNDTVKLVNTRFDSLQIFTTGLFDKTNARIGSLEDKTFTLAYNLRTDTFSEIANLHQDSFNQIGVLNNTLNSQLGTFNTNLNNNIGQLTTAYVGIPAAIGSRFDRQTDCVHNALCWQNMTSDTLTNLRFTGKDISTTMKVFSDGYPHMQDQFDLTVSNFASITTHINKLTTPHWYDRVLGYALNGALLYRNLNPVTNITLTGVQAISGLK
jgi:hypothetical protein